MECAVRPYAPNGVDAYNESYQNSGGYLLGDKSPSDDDENDDGKERDIYYDQSESNVAVVYNQPTNWSGIGVKMDRVKKYGSILEPVEVETPEKRSRRKRERKMSFAPSTSASSTTSGGGQSLLGESVDTEL